MAFNDALPHILKFKAELVDGIVSDLTLTPFTSEEVMAVIEEVRERILAGRFSPEADS